MDLLLRHGQDEVAVARRGACRVVPFEIARWPVVDICTQHERQRVLPKYQGRSSASEIVPCSSLWPVLTGQEDGERTREEKEEREENEPTDSSPEGIITIEKRPTIFIKLVGKDQIPLIAIESGASERTVRGIGIDEGREIGNEGNLACRVDSAQVVGAIGLEAVLSVEGNDGISGK